MVMVPPGRTSLGLTLTLGPAAVLAAASPMSQSPPSARNSVHTRLTVRVVPTTASPQTVLGNTQDSKLYCSVPGHQRMAGDCPTKGRENPNVTSQAWLAAGLCRGDRRGRRVGGIR